MYACWTIDTIKELRIPTNEDVSQKCIAERFDTGISINIIYCINRSKEKKLHLISIDKLNTFSMGRSPQLFINAGNRGFFFNSKKIS